MMRKRSTLILLLALLAGCDVGPTGPSPDEGFGTFGSDGGAMSSMAALPPDLSTPDFEQAPSLEESAARWISHAGKLLARAEQAAGPSPEPPVSNWLQVARQLLGQAQDAFDVGHFQGAINLARASAEKSYQVIEAVSGERGDPDLEDRAAAAIDHAERLFSEAVDLAGPNPERRVRTALAKAQALLEDAIRAFEAEEYQRAIRSAGQSADISETVIRYLNS